MDNEIKLKQEAEQNIASLRHYWDQWSQKDRTAFREWIAQLSELKGSIPSTGLSILLKLELAEPQPDESYDTFSPPIEAIRRALVCWERGEDYGGPNSWEELR